VKNAQKNEQEQQIGKDRKNTGLNVTLQLKITLISPLITRVEKTVNEQLISIYQNPKTGRLKRYIKTNCHS